MDCSLPGSSVHEIFQARILEWVAISFSTGSSQPRDQTWVSLHCRQILYQLSYRGSPQRTKRPFFNDHNRTEANNQSPDGSIRSMSSLKKMEGEIASHYHAYISLPQPTLLMKSFTFEVAYIFYWRRKWQTTPVFLPGKSHGQRTEDLGGLQSMGLQESDMS